IAQNDNWKDTQQTEIERTGIAPEDDFDSALLTDFEPAAYTAVVSGKEDNTGIALVEMYNLPQPAGSDFANLSTRGFVGSGDDVLIAGVIIGGGVAANTNVVVRGLGPSLGPLGVSTPLEDPILNIFDQDGNVIASDDNW